MSSDLSGGNEQSKASSSFGHFGDGLFALLYSRPAPFDEEKWRKGVEAQSIEQLYAPHFSEGRYFNPWMPMEHGGFWRVLKWRLSRKADYA